MIKEALEYIVGLNEPKLNNIDGETYSDKTLHRICHNPKATAIELTTLRSLVDYIKSNTDIMSDKMIVHVVNPTRVTLYSDLDLDRKREYLVEVNAEFPQFPFDRFVGHENFIIGVQSKFIPNNDADLLLKFAGTVEGGTIADYGDDGVSQKATVKTGLASKSDALIPSPVTLKPYRTFTEVDQPESQFVFRMKEDKYEGVLCALFEADGGAWKLNAMENIKEYLERALEGMEQFTIIA
jgi:hypothetical protein